MYIKITKKTETSRTGKTKTYYSKYLVEKVRVPGTNRFQESIILNLSTSLKISKEDRRPLCDRIEMLLNPSSAPIIPLFEEKSPNSDRLDQLAATIVEAIRKKQAAKLQRALNADEVLFCAKDMVSVSGSSFGGEILALKAFNDLNIPTILKNLCFKPLELKLATCQIIGRMLHPASENETSRWLTSNSSLLELLNLDESKVYPQALHRIGDKLALNKAAIEDAMFNIPSLFNQQKTIIFVDLTNTFFEGLARAISKAYHGFSKEKRSDCPLISLAVCINQDGYIIKTHYHPGNVSEPSALSALLAETRATNGNIIVMDKGIATKENLENLEKDGFSYVVADRRIKREFDIKLAKEFKTASGSIIQAYRIKDEDYPGRVKLLCHSNDREDKEISMLLKASTNYLDGIDKMNQGLSKPRTVKNIDIINRRIGKLNEKYSMAAQYYDISVIPSESDAKRASSLVVTKKEKDGSKEELPGVYCILSSDASMTDEDILKTYLKLTDIESVFRCLKNELGLRPNFHKRGDRAENHILITILAYQVVNYIRIALRKQGITDSWETIRNTAEAQKLNVAIAKANHINKAVLIKTVTNLTSPIKSYYQALGLDKKVMKPSCVYVPKSLWEANKAVNY